jgi:hypothetical protein
MVVLGGVSWPARTTGQRPHANQGNFGLADTEGGALVRGELSYALLCGELG